MEVVESKGLNGIFEHFPFSEWKRRFERMAENSFGTYEAALQSEANIAFQPILEFCLTVNCENVIQDVVPPQSAINKKRLSKGKEPFYSYRVLAIPGHSTEHIKNGGRHNGPRLHLRRGHLRRLASGKVTWVRHTMVGKSDRGVVETTYAVSTHQ